MNIFKKIIKWLKKSCCSNELVLVDEYQPDYFYTVKSEDSLSEDSLSYSDSESP